MECKFSDRINDVPRSFIREILKVTLDASVISFAGGLPNRKLFPADQLKDATEKVFEIHGRDIFQYSNSEGFLKLREYISEQYRIKQNLDIPVKNILITNGSQQGLDLLGKTILNRSNGLIIEEPGYLGAIQAFSIYKPTFFPIPVSGEGMDTDKLKRVVTSEEPRLMYTVPNFQNPAGISYSEQNRKDVADIIRGTNTLIIEDDPYGELRFAGTRKPSFKNIIPENTILLGSFSKTIVPGFRLGWIVASDDIMKKLLIAKQATDLHTSHFTQSIIYQYLKDNEVEDHIRLIRENYGKQCEAMKACIQKYFPSSIHFTRPEGGMFLWVTLPKDLAALDLFEVAAKDKVVFVPGDPFYIKKERTNTLRLNFSCVDEDTIETGIKRLSKVMKRMID